MNNQYSSCLSDRPHPGWPYARLSSCHRSKAPAAKRYPFTGRVVSIDDSGPGSPSSTATRSPASWTPWPCPTRSSPPSMLSHLLPAIRFPPTSWSSNTIRANERRSSRLLARERQESLATPHSTARQPPPTRCTCPLPERMSPTSRSPIRTANGFRCKQYRGKTLLVTFIYTRCPFPDFCPRMSSNFAEIYKQLATNPALADTHLLSISFDPEHDTPKVLRDYGFSVAHTHDSALFNRWEFAAAQRRGFAEDCRLLRPHREARGWTDHPQSQHRGHRSRRQDREVVSRQRLAGF